MLRDGRRLGVAVRGVLGLVVIGFGACAAEETGGERAGAQAIDTSYDYWASVGSVCPRGDLEPRRNDPALLSDLENCARNRHTFGRTAKEVWLGDAQLLVSCRDVNDEERCTRHTYAVASPFDRLDAVADSEFTKGAVIVAQVTSSKTFPKGGRAKLFSANEGWTNFILVQNVGGAWKAFVFNSSQATGKRDTLQDLSIGRPPPDHPMPAGAVRWVQPEVASLFGALSGDSAVVIAVVGFQDQLWTRCGSGCCTMSF